MEEIPPEIIERSRRELEELERQFLDRSKQSSSRSRPTKSEFSPSVMLTVAIGDPPMRVPRPKKEDYLRQTPQPNGQIAPWIIPSNSYSYGTEPSNPYSRGNSEFSEKPRPTGYGFSDRQQSEIDLYNLPDAFASTSSLDLLGTLAEMKLPSAKSLENLQKYGMEGGPSTASLSEWYSLLTDTSPSYNSMTDFQNPTTSSPRTSNSLMPWDLKGSQEAISKTQNPIPNQGGLKHSLSRELLQAAADASARDNVPADLEKILREQQIEALNQGKLSLPNQLVTEPQTVSVVILYYSSLSYSFLAKSSFARCKKVIVNR